MSQTALIIGSGFAGLSAASFMAKAGWKVTVIEKNSQPGGRARQLSEEGFVFDMGPSWYWMPDVFERYFEKLGRKASDYYTIKRLDPSYRVYFQDHHLDIPADYGQLRSLFESIEPGSSIALDKFLKEAEFKYELGVKRMVFKPGRSFTEFLDWEVIRGMLKLDVFTSIRKHVSKHFKDSRLQQIMEFPILFLGALPENTPALYSLMNFADIKGGTWYPDGGMYSVVKAMYAVAQELGVKFLFNEPVEEIIVERNSARRLRTSNGDYSADVIISGADYHFTESMLLNHQSRTYPKEYWDKATMAPSCLMYYVGLNKRLKNIPHHSLFFDVPFERHAAEIYRDPSWPSEPLFYVSASSVTDASAAPEGCENLVFLIPVAAGLTGDTEEVRNNYFNLIVERLERHMGERIKQNIIYFRSFSVSDFINDYNSYRGNAYGLANTLSQTAIFRPSCKSRKVDNLYFTGQLTVPGPGVPPCLISGEVVANEILKEFRN